MIVSINKVKQTFGDAKERVVIVPVGYPTVRFSVSVGTGWDEDGDLHDATMRDYLDEIIEAIEGEYDLLSMVEKEYGTDPEEDPEEWSVWEYGCRWYKE
jgi:hypothetical protein